MIFKRTLIFFILIFLTYLMVGVAVKSEALQTGPPEITGISVEEVDSTTEIQIHSNSILSYTIYKPADPYRVVIELQEVELGKFKDKIVVDRAGVMEIIPSRVEGPVKGARLEIILTVPADVKPVQREKALILTFYNPEAEEVVVAAEEEPVPLAEEEAEEALKDAEVIENIELSKVHDKVQVLISGDGKMYPEVFELEGNKLVVDIPGVSTTIESLKTYEPPVLGVRVGKHPDKTRIVFDLEDSTKHDISEEGKQFILFFEMPEVEVAEAVAPPSKEEFPEVTKPEAEPFISKKYVGEKISLDFQDADLIHIFRLLADVSGYNIVVSPQVKGKFSMKLTNVPWDHALDVILRNYGLSKAVEGNIIRIAPTAMIIREEQEIAKAKEAALRAGDLVTRIYPINYADVDKLRTVIEDIMQQRGAGGAGQIRSSVSTDKRTSSLLIRDVEKMQEEYEQVINSLDSPTRQVAIEAKIVEVTINFTRELGIQWGVLWKPTPETEVGGIGTGAGFFTENPLLVNLPAAAGAGSGGALGFGYVAAKDLRALDIQLSAMENSGKGKIVSNPKIITLDNEEAKISQGKQIPYQTVSAEGTQTQFVSANLELIVTPHITPDGTIVMDIETKKNEADFAQTVGGVPTIDTKEAQSQVLIKDGDTLVMGGIFKTNISESAAYVPGFGKIPIFGWLFKTKKKVDTTTELLIFITPRIIK